MAEQILTAVPYPMIGVLGVTRMWGIVCPVHPTYMGSNTPTDAGRRSAEAFAEACACGHPDHRGDHSDPSPVPVRPAPVPVRAVLVCTQCGDVRPDADVEQEGVSKGARCDYLTCMGIYTDPCNH